MARRAHSRVELRRKLTRRGHAAEEVEAAIERLGGLGLQDDRAFAEGHVSRRSRSLGPLALSSELAARGVDREVADKAVARLTPQAQLAAAIEVAERLCGNTRFAGYQELLHSVGVKLMRRGFAMKVARAACEAVWTGTATTAGA